MRRFSIIAGFATVAVAILMCSASAAETNFMGGVHFNVGFPQGDLKDQIDRNAYGIVKERITVDTGKFRRDIVTIIVGAVVQRAPTEAGRQPWAVQRAQRLDVDGGAQAAAGQTGFTRLVHLDRRYRIG